MAEKSQQLVIEALQRALVEPAGLPLFGSRKLPGLFASNAAGKKAAALCQDQGYFQAVNGANGQANFYAISDKGIAFLQEQVEPRPVLEAFIRAIEARGARIDELTAAVNETRRALDALRALAEKTLTRLPARTTLLAPSHNGHASPVADPVDRLLLDHLRCWKALEDCPLPQLYRQAQKVRPELTTGLFHDALRELQGRQEVYLHPWTGPLYQLPEPAFALLIGHEVAYYASARTV